MALSPDTKRRLTVALASKTAGEEVTNKLEAITIIKGVTSLFIGNLGAGQTTDYAAAIPEAVVGDAIILNPPPGATAPGLLWNPWIDTDGQVNVHVTNTDTNSFPGSTADWTYVLIKG